tara:strand:+ start:30 stop:1328 length:1299 start_codon:yes stop_codon:yes gene_type:complete
MASFELNSNLYSKPEIEDILSLTYPYTVENVYDQKKILFVELSNDHQLRRENKTDLATFVEEISTRLVESIVGNEESKISLREVSVEQQESTQTASSSSSSSSSSPSFLRNGNNNTLYPGVDHDVILNKKAVKEAEKATLNDGLHVDEAGAPPGVINPLQYRTIKRAVNIDSRFRPNYYASKASDMQLTLPTRLEKVISMRLGALELPNTFYAISEELGNNCFKVNNSVITIPDGNYTSSSANTQYPYIAGDTMNDALSAAGFPDMSFTVDEASGKSRFTSNSPDSRTITFGVNKDGTNSSEKLPYFLGWQLGYRVNVYTLDTSSSTAVSEGVCQISGPRYLYLAIDDYNNNVNNYFVSAFSDSINNRNILSRIDLPHSNEDGYGSQLNRSRNYFGPVTIEKMQIRLMDEYGRLINMNNMDWSFTLMFECMY